MNFLEEMNELCEFTSFLKSKGSSSESESNNFLEGTILSPPPDLALTTGISLGDDSDLTSGDSLRFPMRGLHALLLLLVKDPPVVVVTVSDNVRCVPVEDGKGVVDSFVLL